MTSARSAGPKVDNARSVSPSSIPFPSLAERFERLEETLQIAHQMWRGGA